LWKNCRKIVERFCGPLSVRQRGKIVDEFLKDFARTPSENISTILPQLFPAAPACRGSAKSFYNFSPILPCVEEFGASGLAWRRIVEGIIVEKLWKHLVNAAPFHKL
jgi:hypothetical protein